MLGIVEQMAIESLVLLLVDDAEHCCACLAGRRHEHQRLSLALSEAHVLVQGDRQSLQSLGT